MPSLDNPVPFRCPVCGIQIDTENPCLQESNVACDSFGGKKYCFCSENCRRHFQDDPRIAYFSMEIGVSSNMPTYSGGLGVLAGDIVKSSADLRLQMVAIALVSRKGYFRQKITEQGEQLEFPDEWDPAKTLTRMPNTVTVNIEGRPVKVQAWLYELPKHHRRYGANSLFGHRHRRKRLLKTEESQITCMAATKPTD